MFAMPVKHFLELKQWMPHQEALDKDLLVEVKCGETAAEVIFCSHQWVSFDHPDPACEQLRALQNTIHKLTAGKTDVKSNGMLDAIYQYKMNTPGSEWAKKLPQMLIWFDYLSIPQPGALLGQASDTLVEELDLNHNGVVRPNDSLEALSPLLLGRCRRTCLLPCCSLPRFTWRKPAESCLCRCCWTLADALLAADGCPRMCLLTRCSLPICFFLAGRDGGAPRSLSVPLGRPQKEARRSRRGQRWRGAPRLGRPPNDRRGRDCRRADCKPRGAAQGGGRFHPVVYARRLCPKRRPFFGRGCCRCRLLLLPLPLPAVLFDHP